MNFFKLHIGDYESATAHLSWDEDAAYNRLMRAYYRREQPIPDAEKYRLIRALSTAHKAACDRVLTEFFTRDGDNWRNKRCDEEIMAYRAQTETNRRIATNRRRTVRDPSDGSSYESSTIGRPNHKPLTTNHEPEVLINNSARINASTRQTEKNCARAFLEKHQVKFDDSWLGMWEVYGLERLEKAIAIAKERLKGQELRAAYLDAVLRDEKNFHDPAMSRQARPWFIESATAIVAKGEALGLKPDEDEPFPYFRIRVFKAAGVTEEMVRKAEAEYRS